MAHLCWGRCLFGVGVQLGGERYRYRYRALLGDVALPVREVKDHRGVPGRHWCVFVVRFRLRSSC